MDDTGEARFFAYDDEATQIIGTECQSIMNPLAQTSGIPQQLRNIVNRKYVFSIDLSNSTLRQYVVKAVLQRVSTRPDQPGSSTAMLQIESGTAPQSLPASPQALDAPLSDNATLQAETTTTAVSASYPHFIQSF